MIINEENYWDFVSDFENFWSKFFDNFKEIDINFLLFVNRNEFLLVLKLYLFKKIIISQLIIFRKLKIIVLKY